MKKQLNRYKKIKLDFISKINCIKIMINIVKQLIKSVVLK